MTRIVAFHGSPRPRGNSTLLLDALLEGAAKNGALIEQIRAYEADIKPCCGCLRCNISARCSIRDDGWAELSEKILDADVLIFASPVYFHHLSAPLKKILDRFRSFMRVRITEDGLEHSSHVPWAKRFVLIQTLGSSVPGDARPAENLFAFVRGAMGQGNRLDTIVGTRLAMPGQVRMSEEELAALYAKLGLPTELAEPDAAVNAALLDRCRALGAEITTA